MTIFVTSSQVADLLEYPNAAAFLRERARLTSEAGFPDPVPLYSHALRWRRGDVLRWMQAAGRPLPDGRPPLTDADYRNVVLLHAARQA